MRRKIARPIHIRKFPYHFRYNLYHSLWALIQTELLARMSSRFFCCCLWRKNKSLFLSLLILVCSCCHNKTFQSSWFIDTIFDSWPERLCVGIFPELTVQLAIVTERIQLCVVKWLFKSKENLCCTCICQSDNLCQCVLCHCASFENVFHSKCAWKIFHSTRAHFGGTLNQNSKSQFF